MFFVQLHNHSDYSLLDGESAISAMVDQVVKLGQSAIAITDHGVMMGAIELLKVCRAKKVKPILGCEFYLMNPETDDRTGTARFNKDGQQRFRKYHQTILALDRKGYENLVKLNNYAHTTNFRQYAKKARSSLTFRPSITLEKLKECSEGLVVLSGCRAGVIPQAILANEFDYAVELAQWYKDVFGERFFLEIQDHGYPEDRVVNVALYKISQLLGIELVATNDSHFTDCQKVERHDVLLTIGTGKLLNDPDRMRYSGTEYIKSAEEMRLLFRDHLPLDVVDRAIANTVLIADWVEDYKLLTDEMQEPEFEVPPGYDTQDDYLRFLGVTGLHRTFPDGIPAGYEERLNTELSVIAEKGFSGYMLIVWDIVKWAREQNIPVGKGRGSVGGSLLAWVIGITGFDPIKYNCLFERFINPKRKSYPDIDLDFCVKRRHEVLNYIVQKYGSDRVCLIGTISRLKSKNAIQDVGRILGIPPWERDKIAEMVPSSRGNTPTLKKILEKPETAPNLYKLYQANPRVKHWIDMAQMVEGSARNAGVHAAGVLISAVSLDKLIPVYSTDAGEIVSQYPKDDVEAVGGLKVDVLGVAELSTIRLAQELIFQNHGVWVDVDSLDPTDAKTFELFKRGETEGVFQFESDGMRGLLIAIAPESLEDLAAITSLYRPGPLDSGMIEMYIQCKRNQSAITYKYPILEEVLAVTYSTIIFQEQVMKLCQVVAGYDLGQADLVRRAMGKKKLEEMAKQKEGFIKGAIANNFDAEWAEKLWSDLERYAEYCFNVPHAIAYSFTSYQTAYLKTYYPVEYLAAILTEKIGKKEDIAKYVAMGRRMGIPILPPDINCSDDVFKPEGNAVRFGLAAISHVGAAAPNIVKARKQSGDYTSLEDFCGSLLPNKGVLNALIHAGAFDCLNPNRHQLAQGVEAIANWIKDELKRLKAKTSKPSAPQEVEGQLALFSPEPFKKPRAKKVSLPKKFPEFPEVADYPIKERIGLEKDFLGFYLSGHPLDDLVDIKKLVSPLPLNKIASRRDGQIVCCMGFISRAKEIRTKKRNTLMSFLTLDDQSGQVEAIAFSDFYESNMDILQEGARLLVTGKVQHKDGKSQIILDFAQSVDSKFTCLLINLSLMQAQERLSLLNIQNTLSSAKRKSHPCPLIITIPGASRGVVLSPQYWVENPELAMQVLSDRGFNVSVISYELGDRRKALTPSLEVDVVSAA